MIDSVAAYPRDVAREYRKVQDAIASLTGSDAWNDGGWQTGGRSQSDCINEAVDDLVTWLDLYCPNGAP